MELSGVPYMCGRIFQSCWHFLSALCPVPNASLWDLSLLLFCSDTPIPVLGSALFHKGHSLGFCTVWSNSLAHKRRTWPYAYLLKVWVCWLYSYNLPFGESEDGFVVVPVSKTKWFSHVRGDCQVKWGTLSHPAHQEFTCVKDNVWRCLSFNLVSIYRSYVNFHNSLLIWEASSLLYTCIYIYMSIEYTKYTYVSWQKSFLLEIQVLLFRTREV